MNPDISLTVSLPPAIQVNVSTPAPIAITAVGIGGPEGDKGDKGDKGDQGEPGATDYEALTNKPTLGTAAATNATDYATAAQGATADTAVQPATLTSGLATKANTVHTHAIADVSDLQTQLNSKQATLVSGTSIKTINGASVLGSGDIAISGGEGGGVTDHGALTGLTDDDHTQYHTDARGDVRYNTKAEITTALAGKANSTHTHTASQVTDFDTEVSNNTDVAANTAARHTHSNSAVLNATTASFLLADETKLDGIAAGATVNDTDANLKSRANHTGTQAQSTIDNLTTDLAAKQAASVIAATAKGYVNHGATAGTARPTGFASIEWRGTVAPTNATTADTWIDVT